MCTILSSIYQFIFISGLISLVNSEKAMVKNSNNQFHAKSLIFPHQEKHQ